MTAGAHPAPRGYANPQTHLRALSAAYPALWSVVDQFRAARGINLPPWPEGCFLPLAGWRAIAGAALAEEQLSPTLLTVAVARLAALGSWRYFQGIYRFDADLTAALVRDDVPDCPALEAALPLPEDCLYIETPRQCWQGATLHGFWVHLEWEAHTHDRELRLLLHTAAELVPWTLPIGPWPLGEAIERVWLAARTHAEPLGLTATLEKATPAHRLAEIETSLRPLVAMVAHLASDAYQRVSHRRGDVPRDSAAIPRGPRICVIRG